MLNAQLEHRIEAADRLRCSSELGQYKALTFSLVRHSARSVLDLGSATGEDVLALAECLGPDCQLIGLELDAGLVDEARRRARNVALDVHFVVGDCHALPFDGGRFDVVRADGVLGALAEPSRAWAECARVLRPGGLVVVHDDARDLLQAASRSGLQLVTALEVPNGHRATPTWLLTQQAAHHVRV